MSESPDLDTGKAGSPALFLDRDGVLIENRPDYVRQWSEAVILPGVVAALARLHASPLKFVIVTNQSAVGRGLIPLAEAQAINEALAAAIVSGGGRVDGVYMCPHTPEENCSCRKPRPGLILQAARELALDLRASTLIGDAESDIQAARAAGLGHCALVRTGRGQDQEPALSASGHDAVPVFDDLAQALRALYP